MSNVVDLAAVRAQLAQQEQPLSPQARLILEEILDAAPDHIPLKGTLDTLRLPLPQLISMLDARRIQAERQEIEAFLTQLATQTDEPPLAP